MKNKKLKVKNYKLLSLLAALVIVLVLASKNSFVKKIISVKSVKKIVSEPIREENQTFLVKPVSAQEIYPMFECPCCGKPIDQCTCPMAKERKAFVDGLTSRDISQDEAVMAYVKNYGLDSFVDKNQAEEFKKKLIAQAPADRPIISVSPETIDMGDVSQAEGEISTLFEITNAGKTDLTINKLDTSCGCTSAVIIFNGEEGPRFAMAGHGIESPTDWNVAIPPGESAQLKVYYDSTVHEDFRGDAIREIYIFSNDPINFETKVKVELNQVD